MESKDKLPLYYGAIMKFDLDSEDVDIILRAAGLSVDKSDLQECVSAVRNYVDWYTSWTPAGPVTNMKPALEKLAKIA